MWRLRPSALKKASANIILIEAYYTRLRIKFNALVLNLNLPLISKPSNEWMPPHHLPFRQYSALHMPETAQCFSACHIIENMLELFQSLIGGGSHQGRA
jgi:hypothetical protein